MDINEPPQEFYDAVARAGLSDRVKITIVSQSDENGLTDAIESYFSREPLDLVIDDASHYYVETRAAFDTVFGSYLKPGGKYVIEDWGCGYWPTWPDGDPDGQHGLPRLVKELIDLLGLADRTKLWDGQRSLQVETELQSPISRVVLLQSLAALTRSDAPMPTGPFLPVESPRDPTATEPAEEPAAEDQSPLGFRALIRLLPAAAGRAVARRWTARRSRSS